ncbi:MAG: A/G-specific adenine glycosylase [Alloprevotella sp.]|nr:A/G-specific adenine glycosylase [Alloprevotella sp.]
MTFTETILHWYAAHRRELPWRNISDPYRIWVSEIILQQTRVAQGYDYYLRFVNAFPTVEALALASEDEVLRLWQGLGYYSRARNLHAAARQVVAQGHFPTDYSGVRALKGVGDYTAAAICSFAYGLPLAVVDGNVYRVLSRYFGVDEPIDTGKGKKQFAALAQSLLPAHNVADYNQGLMDFGALQCVPASPDCAACPLADSCRANELKCVADWPVKSHRTKVAERYYIYIGVSTSEGIWLHRRGAGDIWQGLYEWPLLEFDHAATWQEVQSHPFILNHLPEGGTWKQLARQCKHVLTHRVIWADCYWVTYPHPLPLPPGFIVVQPEELERYAMPRLLLRFLKSQNISE